MALNLRALLGRALTWAEADANFSGLADGSELLDGAISTPKIADNAVVAEKILDGAVGTVKLADGAVSSVKILADAVTTAKIANQAVTYAKLQQVSATDKVLGRATTGAGVVEEIDCTAAGRAMISAADATAQAALLGILPAGTILDYAGASIPSGFLECDGANVSRTTYAALFTALGTTWGSGNGSTTFTLPDLRRRTTIGAGGSAVSGPANTLGSVGGAETHSLSSGELASHTHTGTTGLESAGHYHGGWTGSENATHVHAQEPATHYNNGYSGRQVAVGGGVYCDLPNVDGGAFYTAGQSANHQHYITTGGVSANHTHSFTSDSTGSGTAHNNMQPSVVVKKIIKT